MSSSSSAKNRKSIIRYCVLLRVSVWVHLSCVVLLTIWELVWGPRPASNVYISYLPYLVISRIIPGILALGLAQFIRYVFENEYQPGWLLRHSDKILYAFAILLCVSHVYFYARHVIDARSSWSQFVIVVVLSAPIVLVFIGLGRILRWVMSIIEESKTLP